MCVCMYARVKASGLVVTVVLFASWMTLRCSARERQRAGIAPLHNSGRANHPAGAGGAAASALRALSTFKDGGLALTARVAGGGGPARSLVHLPPPWPANS